MDVATIVAVCVLILFGIVYIILFGFLYALNRKIIRGRLSDDVIEKDIHDQYAEYLETKVSKDEEDDSFMTFHLKKRKKKKNGSIASAVFTWIVCLFCVAILVFSVVVRNSGNHLFFGNTALMVVETGSMSEKYEGNTYLFENECDDQIEGGSLITITNDFDMELLHIYAFESLEEPGTVYIHRLISISYNNDNEEVYTFRGDANNASMLDEMFVSKDRIIGEYTGYQNWGLGQVILYLQSGIGMIAVAVAVMVLFGFYLFADLRDKQYERRFSALSTKAFQITLKWDNILGERKKNEKLLKKIKIVDKGDPVYTLTLQEGYPVLSSSEAISNPDSKGKVKVKIDESHEIKEFDKKNLAYKRKGYFER